VRENCTPGSVRGALRKGRSYRDGNEDRKDWHVPGKPDKNSVVNRERPPAGNDRRPHEELPNNASADFGIAVPLRSAATPKRLKVDVRFER